MGDALRTRFYFPLTRYLSFFAHIVLRVRKKKVIAITGVSGKSSLFELIHDILDKAGVSHEAAEHANSAMGIPLYILGLKSADVHGEIAKYVRWLQIICLTPFMTLVQIVRKKTFQWYLFEQDSDRPGEMEHSGKLLAADLIIWLNTGITHSVYHDHDVARGKFPSIIDSITHDFAFGIKRMNKRGIAIVNTDDTHIAAYVDQARGRVISIGKQLDQTKLMRYTTTNEKTIFDIWINAAALCKQLGTTDLYGWPDTIHIEIDKFLLPEYYYYTFVSGIISCLALHIPYTIFMESIAAYKLPPGRMSIFSGVHNTVLIDSSYNNGNPQALIGALDVIAQFPGTIAILGDMRELGDESKEEHERIGAHIREKHIGKILLVGPLMHKYTYPYLLSHGYTSTEVMSYETPKALKEHLLKTKFADLTDNAVVLIKGSQNTLFLEAIVALLLKDKNDIQSLCRRGSIWDKRRAAIGL